MFTNYLFLFIGNIHLIEKLNFCFNTRIYFINKILNTFAKKYFLTLKHINYFF